MFYSLGPWTARVYISGQLLLSIPTYVREIGETLQVLVQEIGVGPEGNQDPANDDSQRTAQVQDLPARDLTLKFL